MLILTRYTREKIIIKDDIVLEISKVRGEKVTFAIKSPPDTPINTGKILETNEVVPD